MLEKITVSYRYFFIFILLVSLTGCQNKNQDSSLMQQGKSPEKGKEYRVITPSDIIPKAVPEEEVQVLQFFSYDCPTCYALEPVVEAWLKTKPKYVQFEQIPVSDNNPTLIALERVYYVTRMLGAHLPSLIFKLIYEEGKDLSDPTIAKTEFIKKGVSENEYETANNFKAGIETQMARGSSLQKTYNIDTIPVFIVGGRYETHLEMTGGNMIRLFEVIDHLIEKVKKGED